MNSFFERRYVIAGIFIALILVLLAGCFTYRWLMTAIFYTRKKCNAPYYTVPRPRPYP
jgi:hypothetical protein